MCKATQVPFFWMSAVVSRDRKMTQGWSRDHEKAKSPPIPSPPEASKGLGFGFGFMLLKPDQPGKQKQCRNRTSPSATSQTPGETAVSTVKNSSTVMS